MNIHIVPILRDNYAYLLETGQGNCICIDPGESKPVLSAAGKLNLQIRDLINTHHDWDHVNGNEEIKEQTGCRIWAPKHPNIRGVDHYIESENHLTIQGVNIQPLFTPGHQTHDLSFYFPDDQAVFCGDLLMVGGCGRIFTRDPDLMWSSIQKIMSLPDETKLYCGHEYTLDNYTFACTQSDDLIYRERRETVKSMSCTVPTTLEEEKRSNIFIRAETAIDFAQLRSAKDRF